MRDLPHNQTECLNRKIKKDTYKKPELQVLNADAANGKPNQIFAEVPPAGGGTPASFGTAS